MIIGSALGRLFDGLTVDITIDDQTVNREVKYHYGDQKELNKWVNDRNNANLAKYPLVWYVINPYFEETDFKRVRSSLIILQSTTVEWFNTTKSIKSYDDVIEPVWNKVKERIEKNEYISVIREIPRQFRIKDEPNFGITSGAIRLSQDDFATNTESVTTDIVDARIIELEFRIKTNCI